MSRLLVLLVLCFTNSTCFATAKTNINKVDEMLDPKLNMEEQIEEQIKEASDLIDSKKALELIPAMDEVDSTAATLNSIKPTDLDEAGRSKRTSKEYRFFDENELQPDYTKAGNRMHKKDADDIAGATNRALSGLMSKLKDLGIDCRTTRGAIQKEPVYHIELHRETGRNTEYTQIICEEPRNQYSCTSSISLHCAELAPARRIPQTIRISLDEVRQWWAGATFACHTPGVMDGLRALIISKIGRADIEVPTQEIMVLMREYVYYQIDPNGNYGTIQNTWHETDETYNGSVRFFYTIPQAAACLRWSEEWRERCTIR